MRKSGRKEGMEEGGIFEEDWKRGEEKRRDKEKKLNRKAKEKKEGEKIMEREKGEKSELRS